MTNIKIQVKRNSYLIARYNEGKVILLDPNEGKLYTLNQVASCIWRFLWQVRTLKEIVIRIKSKFKVSAQRAEDDVASFVKESLKNKLLKKAG